MTCTKCNETGVYNEVLGHGFYYCRNCKDEIVLEVVDTQSNKLTQAEIDELFKYLPNSNTNDVVY